MKTFLPIALALALSGCRAMFTQTFFLNPSPEFDAQLAAARKESSFVEEYCRTFGAPALVEQGFSGWYLTWKEPRFLLSVKRGCSFGMVYRVLPNNHCAYVGPNTRRLAPVASSVFMAQYKARTSTTAALNPVVAPAGVPRTKAPGGLSQPSSYSIERFARVPGNAFAYAFTLKIKDGQAVGMGQMSAIKEEVRGAVIEDYRSTYAGERFQAINVDFPQFALKDGVVEGRAEVMRTRVVSLDYDAQKRTGVIAVEIGASSFDEARRWVRANIETLVRDKNIRLTTGEVPPAGKFYLGAERVKDGNVLEIEFETE